MGEHSSDADVAFISALAELLNAHELTEITVKREYGEADSLEVHVVKQAPPAPVAAPLHANPAPPPPAQFSAPETAAGAASAPPAAPGGVSEDAALDPNAVPSPMVGTVYLAPEPDAEPFVSVGATVAEGQTLLIIEAMKTMNNILAPRAGVVKAILVANGAPVEYGAPLVIIE